MTQGVLPLAPHTIFTQFLEDDIPEERSKGLRMGLELVEQCSEVYVFGHRISEGMAAEIEAAERIGIPILYYNDRCERREDPHE